MAEYLKDHPGLKELYARRRQARLASALSQEDTASVFQDLVKSDPSLQVLFGKGRSLRVPIGPLPDPVPYEGRRYPTYFRIARELCDWLVKRCPKNRTFRVEHETDAANDYFARSLERGVLEVSGVPVLMSQHLWNGRCTIRFSLPENCNPGDRLGVVASVTDNSRVGPLTSGFSVLVECYAEIDQSGSPGESRNQRLAGLPNIVEVHRDQWNPCDFDEQSAVNLVLPEN